MLKRIMKDVPGILLFSIAASIDLFTVIAVNLLLVLSWLKLTLYLEAAKLMDMDDELIDLLTVQKSELWNS